MYIQVRTNIAKVACRFLLMAYASLAFAAEAEPKIEAGEVQSSFIALYQNYENAAYAVRWYASPKNIATAREKMARYEYLVLYSSAPLLMESTSAVVQFGFFKNQKEASEFVSHNALAFPGAKVVSVSQQEHADLFALASESSPEQPLRYFWLGPNSLGTKSTLETLLKLGKSYYIKKDYQQALKYYGVLSLSQDTATAIWSREVMAVCHERLGQFDDATEVYRHLLQTHPEHKSASRIEQRLRAVETAASDNKQPLRKSSRRQESKGYWRGVIAQSYNSLTVLGDQNEEDRDVLSAIITHYDFFTGINADSYKVDVRFNGYDIYDMSDEGGDSKTAIKRFYVKYSNKSGLELVGGRQKDMDSGVYSSFDGGSLRYSLSDRWTIGVSAGVPVYFSEFTNYIDRQFYSLSASYDSNRRWGISSYITQQTFFGETERSAVGGKLNFQSKSFNSYLNLDYDLEFQELNVLGWSGTYFFGPKSQTTLSYGFQRMPFLSASNIQIGQPYRDVEAYINADNYSYESMLNDALNRTSIYQYGSLSYQYKVDEDLQIITDLYHSNSSEIPIFLTNDNWSTSTVEAYDKDFEYTSVGIQAVSVGFFGKKDTAILGFRHNDTSNSVSDVVQISERLILGKKFFIKPKLAFHNIKSNDQESGQNKISGSVVLSYKPIRSAEIKAEFGSDTVKDLELKQSVDIVYFNLGYQARF